MAKKGKGKEAKLCFGAHVLMDNREVPVCITVRTNAAQRASGLRFRGRYGSV